MKTIKNFDYQACYDYLIENGLNFCISGRHYVTIHDCIANLPKKQSMQSVLEELAEMEALISSKSSDYNKGVQDCINIFKKLNK